MLTRQEMWRTVAAVTASLAVWGVIRLVFPSLDYHPPEMLLQGLQRSWFIVSGTHKLAQLGYALGALILMALFFAVVQRRWPGRSGANGLIFGILLGILWAFAFLTASAHFGSALSADLLNGVLDLAALALGGWLNGLALGQDFAGTERGGRKPWPAVIFVATGFVLVHTLGAMVLHAPLGPASALYPRPETALQYASLVMVGLWAGVMYVILRAALPFGPAWANAAFFAFGIFGHSWTWFKLYSVLEFSGVLFTTVLIGVSGALGVFSGALAYECGVGTRFLETRRKAIKPRPSAGN